MDALELGNDSGSLLACRNRQHSPQARGGFLGWTRRPGLDQQRTGSSSGLEGGLAQRAGKAGD